LAKLILGLPGVTQTFRKAVYLVSKAENKKIKEFWTTYYKQNEVTNVVVAKKH